MIEDLQDELQKDQPPAERKPRSRWVTLLLAFIIWLLYAAIIILSFSPRIIRAVRQSDLAQTIQDIQTLHTSAQTLNAKLCFVIPTPDGTPSMVICNQTIPRTGATAYHDVIEGLLAGPQQDALSIGAITYIAPTTQLIGLTVSAHTAFVNLSDAFTSSGSTWGPSGLDTARLQITRTLQALDPTLKDVVILINSEPLDL